MGRSEFSTKNIFDLNFRSYWSRKFKVEKSTGPGNGLRHEVQEVSKTCSGVRFGQQAHDPLASKSATCSGQISLCQLVVRDVCCTPATKSTVGVCRHSCDICCFLQSCDCSADSSSNACGQFQIHRPWCCGQPSKLKHTYVVRGAALVQNRTQCSWRLVQLSRKYCLSRAIRIGIASIRLSCGWDGWPICIFQRHSG